MRVVALDRGDHDQRGVILQLGVADTKLGICIADVVGNGVSAALLMANVQATVRAYASESATSSWLCSKVNGVLSHTATTSKPATCALA